MKHPFRLLILLAMAASARGAIVANAITTNTPSVMTNVVTSIAGTGGLVANPFTTNSTGPATPSTLFVRTNGSDSLGVIGSEALPFLTVSNAFRLAPSNSTVRVGAGYFTMGAGSGGFLHFSNSVTRGAITIKGEGRGITFLTNGLQIRPYDNCVLKDFSLRGVINLGYFHDAAGVYVPAKNVVIDNVEVIGGVDALYLTSCMNLFAQNCTFSSGFDGVADFTTPDNSVSTNQSDYTLVNCYIAGISNLDAGASQTHGLSAGEGIGTIIGGMIRAEDSLDKRTPSVILQVNTGAHGGVLNLYNVAITNFTGTGATNWDIFDNNAGLTSVNLRGTFPNPSKISTTFPLRYEDFAASVGTASSQQTNFSVALYPGSSGNMLTIYTVNTNCFVTFTGTNHADWQRTVIFSGLTNTVTSRISFGQAMRTNANLGLFVTNGWVKVLNFYNVDVSGTNVLASDTGLYR